MIDLLPNETIVFQWVIFMTAVLTLHFGIFRPALKILDERESRTAGAKKEAEESEKKSQEVLAVCEKRVEEAHRTGARKKEEIRATGERYAEDLMKKTRGELERRMEEARQKIEKESKEAALLLKQVVRELSHEMASKILEREV